MSPLPPTTVRLLARLAGLALALWLTLPGLLRPLQGHWLENANLVCHEAGHLLFALFGETVMLLGGSLMQLLVPLACAGTFFLRGDRYSAGLVGLWFAHSLAGVAAYVADARVRQLDLVTGDPDTHDWWQLLGGWGRLEQAEGLGRVLFALAVVSALGAVFLALWDDLTGRRAGWADGAP